MHVAALREKLAVVPVAAPLSSPAPESGAMVRLLTCGSVDDGKSTLIGRLLWDSAAVAEDQRAAVMHASQNRALNGEKVDFSLLLDGLQAEREQGITIDIAWRYFETTRRRFVIIDAPGHEQYTRNMATGASHADVAILLVDARHGVKRQTRRLVGADLPRHRGGFPRLGRQLRFCPDRGDSGGGPPRRQCGAPFFRHALV
jgi:bifunctional enzyme CysN/CysC